MSTYVNIIFTLFFLVPGFIALRIRQRTTEYRDLSAFEFTSVSIAYSFIIGAIWLALNWALLRICSAKYSFFEQLRIVIVNKDFSQLFSPFSAIFILTYANAFCAFSLWLFNFHWMGLGKRSMRSLGLTRFTNHLTPWEDFQTISQVDWIAVELKDGRTLLGKLGIGSHLPFERELVLKGVSAFPVTIYDENHRRVDFGPKIDMSYVNISEVKAIHRIIDESIAPISQSLGQSLANLLFLLLAISTMSIAFSLIAFNIGGYYKHSPLWDILSFLLAVGCILTNLRFLKDYSPMMGGSRPKTRRAR